MKDIKLKLIEELGTEREHMKSDENGSTHYKYPEHLERVHSN